MKTFPAFILGFVFCASVLAQSSPVGFDLSNFGVRIEPDRRVMTVLATLEAARTTNAAGESVPVLNTPLSAQGAKFRDQLRSDLARLDPKLRERISLFVVQHKRRNADLSDAQITASFVSMAYALTPVPELADPVVTIDLPGNLLDVLDFAPLVRDFYRASSFSANLSSYLKNYSAVADGSLRRSTGDMVTELLSYLQTRPQIYYSESVRTETQKSGSKKTTLTSTERRERERRFILVPEMLAPAGNVVFLNVKDDYYAVVPPDTDVTLSETRRAFLQFVIDPLVLGSAKDIAIVRDAVKKLIEDQRAKNPLVSPDVFLTISRSLVAAIDSKQNENLRIKLGTAQFRQKIETKKTEAEKKQVFAELEKYKAEQADETILRLSEDYERGATLVFYFADQLKGIEDSGFNIAASLREMILSLDTTKEVGRYEQVAEARKRALAVRETRKANPNETIIIENPVTTRLLAIDKIVESKNYVEARAELRSLLDKNPSDARIHYNYGRVTGLLASEIVKPEEAPKQRELLLDAKEAFEKVIRLAAVQRTDAALVSLSYVALAKIYEHYGDSTYAIGIYDAAIRVGDVNGGAYSEALTAKARLMKDQ